MRTLTVLYDAHCELCRRVRTWLERQPKYVAIAFIAAGSPMARELFPSLDHAAPGELVVVSDDGAVWRGPGAWITCLWALRNYRGWAIALSESGRLEQARGVIDAVSRNRHRLGWLGRFLEIA